MSKGSAQNLKPAKTAGGSPKPQPTEQEFSASRGVIRRIDDLGRVVIPSEYRKVLGINLGDHLDMTLEGSGIVLRRIETVCTFCASPDDLSRFENRPVCSVCRRRLQSGEGL